MHKDYKNSFTLAKHNPCKEAWPVFGAALRNAVVNQFKIQTLLVAKQVTSL